MTVKLYPFSLRNIVLAFICLTSTMSVRGQGYYPMLADSNSWYATYWFEGCYTTKYETNGDSTIHGIKYKKLQAPYYAGYSNIGYLREDTILKKVYAKFASDVPRLYPFDSALLAFDDTSEFLYYDFNLATGDSLFIIAPELIMAGPYRSGQGVDTLGWYYVDSVASLTTLGGIRKAIYLRSHPLTQYCCSYEFMVWVEGVGALYGPYLGGGLNFLSCYYKNNVHEYFKGYDDTTTSCYCSGLGINEVTGWKSNLSLSPNPSSDLVTIRVSGDEQTLSAGIYDISGRHVETLFTDWRFTSFQFDIQPLVSGLYFVKVINQDGEQAMLKLFR